MKIGYIGLAVLLLSLVHVVSAFSQLEIIQLEMAWEENRYVDIQKLLPQAVKKYPTHPTVLFFRAFCETDAEKAMVLYNQTYSEHHDHAYSDAALYRMGQYQYVLEKPEVARRYFAYLYHTYPQSKWADDAQYLTAQCYIVEGKLDSANRLLKQFVRVHPRSLFADLAVADLESDIWDTEEPADPMPDKPVMPKPTTGKAYWAIQVGAFTVRENATNILKGLQEVGYHGEIVQKRVGNRLFHAVWIGQFKDRASAEAYAQRFVVKLTKEYQIVKKP